MGLRLRSVRLFSTGSPRGGELRMVAHSLSMVGVDSSVPASFLEALRAQRAELQHMPSLVQCVGAGTVAGAVGAVVGVGGGEGEGSVCGCLRADCRRAGVIAAPILRMAGMEQKRASATVLPMVLCSAAVAAVTWHLNTPVGAGPDVLGGLVIGGVRSGVALSVCGAIVLTNCFASDCVPHVAAGSEA